MNKKDNYYITTAISYLNGKPHLGHAYEVIFTDVLARFHRLSGKTVYFLTGTDEHGEKVAMTAEKNDMDPRSFCNSLVSSFTQMADDLNISNDDFIRTTEERHYLSAKALWEKMETAGDIYLGAYEGWYSVRDESYFSEDELTKDEETGQKLAPSGAEVIWREEPSYFFRLSEYTDKLLALYEEKPEFIQPESRRNEVISFVKQGLKDLSVSRATLDWGIPVPGHGDGQGNDKHVMYVWVDALTNYITALGYPDETCEKFQSFWPANVHVIGKDIIRFHTVFWPAFLMAAGLELPKTVFAHGFINVEGQKMSKSIGNVLSPSDLLESFGVDGLRYLLTREIPHGQDGNFSHTHGIQRVNSDLSNALGNLAQRTLSMIHKNCDGVLPEPGEFLEEDQALLSIAYHDLLPALQKYFESYQLHRAMEEIMKLAYEANAYVDTQAPWTLKKENPERMKTVLYVLAEVIRCLAIVMQPVTPQAASKLLDQLSVSEGDRLFAALSSEKALKAGIAIEKPEGVFPRLELKDESEEAAA